jgi:hypothetical protein
MTNEKSARKKFSRWQIIIRVIILGGFSYLLYELYWILIDVGTYPFIAILILIFLFLLFLGILLKRKGESFFSRFMHTNKEQTDTYKSNKPRVRRVDLIALDSKYKKPIIRKCPNCGIQLASFVKKCPNCGEEMLMT